MSLFTLHNPYHEFIEAAEAAMVVGCDLPRLVLRSPR